MENCILLTVYLVKNRILLIKGINIHKIIYYFRDENELYFY